jgi:hexosaminidase
MSVIPRPAKTEKKEGIFRLTSETAIVVSPGSEETGHYLSSLLGLSLRQAGSLQGSIVLEQVNEKNLGAEGYRLRVTEDGIQAQAAGQAGLFYAVQTLRQLLPPELEKGQGLPGEWSMPCVEIEDRPRFAWRGLHLDVGRHFFPVEFIGRYLELMALHKLNRFHWHLTEDQGWRLEVPKYPKLTQVGAWRREKDGTRYGGFYTQREVRRIVERAQRLHIEVVPEIEMPGHAQAALAAYGELSCAGGPFEVWNEWGVSQEVFCAGNEAVFELLEGVLEEVMALFPGQYVHIGGDECPKDRWKECAKCQQRKRDEKLEDEEALQSYFVQRMASFLAARGKKPIGWDEILEGGLAEEAAVMSWRGTKGGIAAARAGHEVVMCPYAHVYFDYKHYQGEEEPGRLGVTSLEQVYGYEPMPEELSAEESRHVLGAQGNAWSEGMAIPQEVEQLAFPRACALAEVVWSPKEARDWEGFRQRLRAHGKRLEALGVNFYRDRAVWG